jgi:hypothetical protein
MSSDRPFYGLAKFQEGTKVRITTRENLEEFLRTWKFHHKLDREQIEYAERSATVEKVFMYHGGDIIYQLENIPGLWHQHLLEGP